MNAPGLNFDYFFFKHKSEFSRIRNSKRIIIKMINYDFGSRKDSASLAGYSDRHDSYDRVPAGQNYLKG